MYYCFVFTNGYTYVKKKYFKKYKNGNSLMVIELKPIILGFLKCYCLFLHQWQILKNPSGGGGCLYSMLPKATNRMLVRFD